RQALAVVRYGSHLVTHCRRGLEAVSLDRSAGEAVHGFAGRGRRAFPRRLRRHVPFPRDPSRRADCALGRGTTQVPRPATLGAPRRAVCAWWIGGPNRSRLPFSVLERRRCFRAVARGTPPTAAVFTRKAAHPVVIDRTASAPVAKPAE